MAPKLKCYQNLNCPQNEMKPNLVFHQKRIINQFYMAQKFNVKRNVTTEMS